MERISLLSCTKMLVKGEDELVWVDLYVACQNTENGEKIIAAVDKQIQDGYLAMQLLGKLEEHYAKLRTKAVQK